MCSSREKSLQLPDLIFGAPVPQPELVWVRSFGLTVYMGVLLGEFG